MGSLNFGCGCSINWQMGNGALVYCSLCPNHKHLYHDGITSEELRNALMNTSGHVEEKQTTDSNGYLVTETPYGWLRIEFA